MPLQARFGKARGRKMPVEARFGKISSSRGLAPLPFRGRTGIREGKIEIVPNRGSDMKKEAPGSLLVDAVRIRSNYDWAQLRRSRGAASVGTETQPGRNRRTAPLALKARSTRHRPGSRRGCRRRGPIQRQRDPSRSSSAAIRHRGRWSRACAGPGWNRFPRRTPAPHRPRTR